MPQQAINSNHQSTLPPKPLAAKDRTLPYFSLFLCFLGLFVTHAAAFAQAGNIQFWLGGEDPITVRDKHRDSPADFMDLFSPNAPWPRSAQKVSVFKISMQFASRGSESDLAALVAGLRQRKIALGIEMGMLRNDRGCGKGEGYMSKDLLIQGMKRIKQAGGQLEYVTMDEVVFFGHEKTWPDQPGQTPCRDSLDEIAKEIAENVTLIHQYFPEAKIGAAEPITTNNQVDLNRAVKDYVAFADLYRQATGSNLAFMHADIAWRSKNWQPGLAPLKAAMVSRGIRFGIIIGGNPDFKDDVSWTHEGLSQLRSLSSNPATAPQDIVMQSWQPLPSSYLPESQPGTTTWMLLQAENMVH